MKRQKPLHRPSKHRQTDWTPVADWYDTLVGNDGSEFHQHVVLPGTVRLLGCRPGEHVLDVACGQGVLCRILADAGIHVTGVDLSRELVAAARKRGPDSVRYEVADARDLSKFAEASFDAAACVLAIQNINPIQPVFRGVSRLLKPGGRFVTVMMHPCFRGPKETSWGWDDSAGVQFRRVDRYLLPRKSPIVAHPGKGDRSYTWTFHRPLQAYFKSLASSGMVVQTLEEWTSHKVSTSGPRAPAENRAREEIPMFLAIRSIRLNPA
jgi:ubiquinone/menaquinone biosynthesis C-methylase UbiE